MLTHKRNKKKVGSSSIAKSRIIYNIALSLASQVTIGHLNRLPGPKILNPIENFLTKVRAQGEDSQNLNFFGYFNWSTVVQRSISKAKNVFSMHCVMHTLHEDRARNNSCAVPFSFLHYSWFKQCTWLPGSNLEHLSLFLVTWDEGASHLDSQNNWLNMEIDRGWLSGIWVVCNRHTHHLRFHYTVSIQSPWLVAR